MECIQNWIYKHFNCPLDMREDVYIIFLIICEICKDEKMSKSIHKGKSSGIKCNNR